MVRDHDVDHPKHPLTLSSDRSEGEHVQLRGLLLPWRENPVVFRDTALKKFRGQVLTRNVLNNKALQYRVVRLVFIEILHDHVKQTGHSGL